MPRIARVVVPGEPHHITQRGNRRLPTFFQDDDYRHYLHLMREWCGKCGVAIWAYCLMTNHVHLIAVPEDADGLRRAMGEAHRRYTLHVNQRQGWTGHLWQGRFASFPMDESHLLAAARYVERNPVAAGMAAMPGDYPWSSARAHLDGRDDGLASVEPLLALCPDWQSFINMPSSTEQIELMTKHDRTGRPLGGEGLFQRIKATSGRDLRPRKAGRKKRK